MADGLNSSDAAALYGSSGYGDPYNTAQSTDWGGLLNSGAQLISSGAQLYGGYQAAQGDPNLSAMGGIGQQLNNLMANPDSVYQSQQYKSAFNQGQNAVNSTLAAQGLNQSGNQLAALQNYGQSFGQQAYNNQFNQLSQVYGQTVNGGASNRQAQSQAGQSAGSGLMGAVSGIGGIINAGSSIIDTIGSIAAWVICTELMMQGRMPIRYYVSGARVFANYPESVKRGYHYWAVPSVWHLRKHPNSFYSKFLCTVFNCRAENIASKAGIKLAKPSIKGALVTAILYPICWIIGVTIARNQQNINQLYMRG